MPVEKHLPAGQFNNVIRLIKLGSIDQVKSLKTATWNAMKRLGISRNKKVAKVKVPKGSDQVDIGSLIAWMDKIEPGDKKAVGQVVIIDATACRRVDG